VPLYTYIKETFIWYLKYKLIWYICMAQNIEIYGMIILVVIFKIYSKNIFVSFDRFVISLRKHQYNVLSKKWWWWQFIFIEKNISWSKSVSRLPASVSMSHCVQHFFVFNFGDFCVRNFLCWELFVLGTVFCLLRYICV